MNFVNPFLLLPQMGLPLQPLSACPVTAGLVYSLSGKTQAPIDLILMSALSSYSILLQGLIDVERPGVGLGPVSLYTLTIAESGERKSTNSKLLNKPMMDFQVLQDNDYRLNMTEFNADYEIFEEEIKSIKKNISKKLMSGECVDDLKVKLLNLKQSEPKKPKRAQLIFEDVTPESMAFELSQGWGNSALVSDEGGTILSGRVVQGLPRLNKLWSAESFTVNRKSSDSYTVDNARLTISIMAQSSAVTKFMKKRGDESLGIGFWARFLVCNPLSSQGGRFLGGVLNDEGGYQKYLQVANDILVKVKEHIESSGGDKKVVRFSMEAKRHWVNRFNQIESNIQVNGRYQYAKDHGSKLAENIARIAALLTYIEQGDGKDISLDILLDAEKIAFYFSDVYLRYFQALPECVKDVTALREYLHSVMDDGERYIRKNKIRQSGPSCLRSKSLLDRALLTVTQNREVSILNGDNGMVVVDLHPNAWFDKAQWERFCYKNKCGNYSWS